MQTLSKQAGQIDLEADSSAYQLAEFSGGNVTVDKLEVGKRYEVTARAHSNGTNGLVQR